MLKRVDTETIAGAIAQAIDSHREGAFRGFEVSRVVRIALLASLASACSGPPFTTQPYDFGDGGADASADVAGEQAQGDDAAAADAGEAGHEAGPLVLCCSAPGLSPAGCAETGRGPWVCLCDGGTVVRFCEQFAFDGAPLTGEQCTIGAVCGYQAEDGGVVNGVVTTCP